MAWFQVNFFSECLTRSVSLHVLIPSDSAEQPADPGRKYRTLYLLHGYTGSSACWLLNGQVNELSQRYDLAVVMMSGGNGFFIDQPNSGNQYGAYIGRELVDFTRRLFPLSPERYDTLIGGMSMGGYGAIYNAFRWSGVFGHAVALSGAVSMARVLGEGMDAEEKAGHLSFIGDVFGDIAAIPDSDMNPAAAAKRLLESGEPLPDLYLACGRDDILCGDNREFSEYLNSIGFPHFYEEGPGGHEWPFWRAYLERGVARALGADRSPVGIRADGDVLMEGGI